MSLEQLAFLCKDLRLGEIARQSSLTGGLLNQMYLLETSKGKYAIKALNPQIMLRPTALTNYINSEHIAETASKHIPALPAKRFDGRFLHQVDDQYYLIFDWVEGKTLKAHEIKNIHCEQIGSILAQIHLADFPDLELTIEVPGSHVDWDYYLEKGQGDNAVWLNQLLKVKDKLITWQNHANESANVLANNMVVSHRDLDPKNVLWHNGQPVVIDWEAAGLVSPLQELLETAIYWSAGNSGKPNKLRFSSFINSYQMVAGPLRGNWKLVLYSGFMGKLGWLEYNLKRSLWIECNNAQEQQLGTNQVLSTIASLKDYADSITLLEEWLNAMSI